MPIYTYACSKCKAEVEELQKFEDPPPPACSSCKEEGSMKRQLSKSNFSLKGGGWADDGYA
jgi:putative FmdB family regulatory protein